MQAQEPSTYPLLYSLQGFQYCVLLLAAAERVAWHGRRDAALTEACGEVAKRAAQTLAWITGKLGLHDEALDHLTLARSALYTDRLHHRSPGAEAQRQTEAALAGLRKAGAQEFISCGLLTRAWLRHGLGDAAGATADLAEAQRIAARGGMRLHLADIALTRARLFADRAALGEARRLIEECGYGRRLPELADAEQALALG